MKISALIILLFLSGCDIVLANITPDTYTPEQICNAIWFAEGGEDAQYKYGIRSVHYESEEEARAICIRTATRNIKRYYQYRQRDFTDYLKFFANRYCPVGAKNDPLGKNNFWYDNVKYFLDNPKEIK